MQSDTLSHLQTHVKQKVTDWGFDDETLEEELLLLTEEVGELVKACRKHTNISVSSDRVDEHEVGPEVVDVIYMAIAIANKLGIDLETEWRKKEAVVDARNYKRPRPTA